MSWYHLANYAIYVLYIICIMASWYDPNYIIHIICTTTWWHMCSYYQTSITTGILQRGWGTQITTCLLSHNWYDWSTFVRLMILHNWAMTWSIFIIWVMTLWLIIDVAAVFLFPIISPVILQPPIQASWLPILLLNPKKNLIRERFLLAIFSNGTFMTKKTWQIVGHQLFFAFEKFREVVHPISLSTNVTEKFERSSIPNCSTNCCCAANSEFLIEVR